MLTAGPADRRGRLLPKGCGAFKPIAPLDQAESRSQVAGYRLAGASKRSIWIDTRTLPDTKVPPAAVITTGVSA